MWLKIVLGFLFVAWASYTFLKSKSIYGGIFSVGMPCVLVLAVYLVGEDIPPKIKIENKEWKIKVIDSDLSALKKQVALVEGKMNKIKNEHPDLTPDVIDAALVVKDSAKGRLYQGDQKGRTLNNAIYNYAGLPEYFELNLKKNKLKAELVARKHGIDPILFYYLIQKESIFSPRAVSKAGARGLTQVLPSTAKDTIANGGCGIDNADKLFEVDTSLACGAMIFKRLLVIWDKEFPSDHVKAVRHALGSYNAGLQGVKRGALTKYPETINYVKTITNNWLNHNFKKTLDGLKINSPEAYEGGKHHLAITHLAHKIQKDLGNKLKWFSAFNDGYHWKYNNNSKHRKGLAIDLIITNKHESKEVTDMIKGYFKSFCETKRKGKCVTVLDEYRFPSSKATGGHIHVQFHNNSVADKWLKLESTIDY